MEDHIHEASRQAGKQASTAVPCIDETRDELAFNSARVHQMNPRPRRLPGTVACPNR